MRFHIIAGLSVLLATLAGCSSDIGAPSATVEGRGDVARPGMDAEAEVGRDEAIAIASQSITEVFDRLRSFGQYTTVIQTRRLALAELTSRLDATTRAEQRETDVWVVQIELRLIGTPAGPKPTYQIIGVNPANGFIEFSSSRQTPVLAD